MNKKSTRIISELVSETHDLESQLSESERAAKAWHQSFNNLITSEMDFKGQYEAREVALLKEIDALKAHERDTIAMYQRDGDDARRTLEAAFGWGKDKEQKLAAAPLTGNENAVNCDGLPNTPHIPIAIIRGKKCPACEAIALLIITEKERDVSRAKLNVMTAAELEGRTVIQDLNYKRMDLEYEIQRQKDVITRLSAVTEVTDNDDFSPTDQTEKAAK